MEQKDLIKLLTLLHEYTIYYEHNVEITYTLMELISNKVTRSFASGENTNE